MVRWMSLIVVGVLLYALTYAPVFPADWSPFTQLIGGVLILIGAVIFILDLLGVRSAR